MRTSPAERESMLREENRRLREQLEALAEIGWQLQIDNMHFHERAMADPFEAESYVQEMGAKILAITGPPPGIEVVDVGSNPAISPPECDGTRYCVAETHIHGCFAERAPASRQEP